MQESDLKSKLFTKKLNQHILEMKVNEREGNKKIVPNKALIQYVCLYKASLADELNERKTY